MNVDIQVKYLELPKADKNGVIQVNSSIGGDYSNNYCYNLWGLFCIDIRFW